MSEEEKFQFTFDCGVTFTEEEESKIQCGKCGKQFVRIISHLQGSVYCSANLDLNILKCKLDKFNVSMGHKKVFKMVKLVTIIRWAWLIDSIFSLLHKV